jgi:Flp pilus assembly protein TadG
MAKCLRKETSTRVCRVFSRRLAREVRGQELVEFAFILPVLLMLLLGIFYFGRAISVYEAIGRAAREGARVALARTCATCGDAQIGNGAVRAAVDNALTASQLDPFLALVPNPVRTVLNPGDPANYQVNQVSVTVRYPIRFPIPFTGRLSRRIFLLTSVVSMRQEY